MYLSKAFSFGMLFKAEGWEMDPRAKDPRFGEDADTANTVDLHLHVRITVGVSQICQMWSPCRVFCVALHDDGIFVQSVCECECCF